MENQDISTHMDDNIDGGQSEQDLLDAVMRNSPIMDEVADVPLPTEGEEFDDSADSEAEDPEEEEVVSEDDDEEVEVPEVGEDGDDGEEPSTEVDIYTADDLDLDAKLVVKVDGEEQEVSFGDLLKGYQTDAHLSKKGRELGEQQKQLEEERSSKLGELDEIATASSVVLTGTENALSKQYHELTEQIKKARSEGNTYELGELKDKREQIQENYWQARNRREGLMKQVKEAKAEQETKQLEEQLNTFQEVIPTMIPDFSEQVAMDIRDFAMEEGIAEELLNNVVDPTVVKFIDDYRRLKQGVSKGKAKRKAAPAKKALPTKKAPSTVQKKQKKADAVRSKVLSGEGSKADEEAFLKQFANRSLGKT